MFEVRAGGRIYSDKDPTLAYAVRVWWNIEKCPNDHDVRSIQAVVRHVCGSLKPDVGCGELAKRVSVSIDHFIRNRGDEVPREPPTVEVMLQDESCGAVYYPVWP